MAKKLIRLTESDLHRIIKESVKRVIRLTEAQEYPPEFIEWLNSPEQGGYYWNFNEKPEWQKRNIYQMYQQEMAEKNFTDGMRVGNRQGFRNKDTGEIEWHGERSINGWPTEGPTRWTPPTK